MISRFPAALLLSLIVVLFALWVPRLAVGQMNEQLAE
jgi:hypothetical protein